MAVAAVDADVADVMLVAERDGLRQRLAGAGESGRLRRPDEQRGRHHDGDGEKRELDAELAPATEDFWHAKKCWTEPTGT